MFLKVILKAYRIGKKAVTSVEFVSSLLCSEKPKDRILNAPPTIIPTKYPLLKPLFDHLSCL